MYIDEYNKNFASQLFFSKEAAEYLGISVQRLNKLIQTGKIKPLKKNNSGTVFLYSELEKRKKELAMFSEIGGESSTATFKIDTPTKQEALNFSAIMNLLNCSEKKLSPSFEKLSKLVDIQSPIPDCLDIWSDFFKFNHEEILASYNKAKTEFVKLKADDEIIKLGDAEYPDMLARTEEAPRFLYLRGDKSLLLDDRTVALVGSRQASEEGKRNTERVVDILGRNGIIIVSGLARGIDVTAHIAAIKNNFKTIAVIGTHLNQYYPSENREVQLEIEKKGLIVSQFSPSTKTERWFFPLRNGVMSGMSQATVIMEAGETSGALKQATFALKQKHLVLIPQNIFKIPGITWPAKFEKKGAIKVNSPKDIIKELSKRNVYKIEKEIELDLDYSRCDKMIIDREAEYNASDHT